VYIYTAAAASGSQGVGTEGGLLRGRRVSMATGMDSRELLWAAARTTLGSTAAATCTQPQQWKRHTRRDGRRFDFTDWLRGLSRNAAPTTASASSN
jgi:hypothetical protein